MEFISVNSIGEYLEDFLFAKVDIEKKLLEEEKIEKRMKLEDFIIYLNLQEKVYMKGQRSIAFNILSGLNNDYVFYSFLEEANEELLNSFKEKLKKIKYNFSNLNKMTNIDLIQEGALDNEIIMINFELFR